MFYILAVIGVLWGAFTGRACATMSNGPKQGTRNGAFFFAGVAGLVVGALVGLFSTVGFIPAVLIGLVTALGATTVGFMGATALSN